MTSYTAIALEGFPLIKSGDNIARTIFETAEKNNVQFEDGDIVVISQKIVSKAEKRVRAVKYVAYSKKAEEVAKKTKKCPKFVELVLRETKNIVSLSRGLLLIEDSRGSVCINAGIDKSNIEGVGNLALLPKNPDRSAEKCRRKLKKLTGKEVAVIICDTYSRPFRRGQVNFAIGLSGLNPFKDYRGRRDLFEKILRVKNVAIVDEVAAAAELLMGQAKEAKPVVIFKGLKKLVEFCEECSAKDLYISNEEDLFKNAL